MGIADRNSNETNNFDLSDNSVVGLQDQAQNFENADNISITDGGAVQSAIDGLTAGFGSLIDGFQSVVSVQGNTFDAALGFSGQALEESANVVGTVKSGENFSTVTNSKNVLIAGGLLATAIIGAMVLRK